MPGAAPRRPVLLSLKPRFAAAILDGVKTAEVRKQKAGIDHGSVVVLYASSPVMAIVGTALVVAVDHSPVAVLWERHGGQLALERSEYYEYMAGYGDGCVITLGQAMAIDQPIALTQLREQVRSFRPPQSYRFVAASDPISIRELSVRIGRAASPDMLSIK